MIKGCDSMLSQPLIIILHLGSEEILGIGAVGM